MVQTPIKSSDFLVERPLPWNVYDASGTLLYAKGSVLDADTKARLIKRGALRDLDADIVESSREMLSAQGSVSASASDRMQGTKIPFNETAVNPGDTIHVERSQDGLRLTARLIGYLKNKSIVITVPVDEQGHIYLKHGEAILAKVFSGKHVLVFPSTVLAVPTNPYPHIHLTYPSMVTGFVVRKTERAGVRLIAAIEAGGESVTGIVTDLSMGGASFVTRHAGIQPRSEVVLNFKLQLAEATFIMKLRCVVRAVRGLQSDVLDGAMGYGAEFRELSPEDVLVLGLYVSQKKVEARSALV